MSTSTDLRRIVGAMTERPWKRHVSPLADALGVQHVGAVYHGDGYVADCIGSANEAADTHAIAALANHAEALVALVEAVERWRHTRASDTRELMAAVRAVDAALAAVHAVRGEP